MTHLKSQRNPPARQEKESCRPHLNCDFNQQQHQFSKVELSPSPSISSTETRRVFTPSSGCGLSCICSSESLSSSSSIGFKTYDDTDDTTESSSTTGEDDPIISFGALSLDTQRTTLGVATTPTRVGTILKTKTALVEDEQEERSKGVVRGMNRTQEQEQEPPKESLNLVSWEQHSWNSNSLETINIVPFAHLSDDSSARLVSFPKEEKQHQQQRRTTTSKKYTIKKTLNEIRSISITDVESPKASQTKRQRGGSDFTMASASGVGDATNSSSTTTSPSSRRKRRRINRNRAMAADDFDSILSQINTTGSL